MFLGLIVRYLAREIAPQLDWSRCLNFHHPGRCRRCFYSCPTGAISVEAKISINENTCSGCGICTAACPADCLELPDIDWLALYANAVSCQVAHIGCRKSASPLINITVPCLGAIPAEFFASLSLASSSHFIIDLTPCSKCKHKRALLQLRRSLRKAENYSGSKIRFKALFSKLTHDNNSDLIYVDNITVLKRNCTELTGSIINNLLHEQKDSGPSIKNSSSNRILLKNVLTNNPHAAIYLTSWQVTAKCTGCALCQGSCPHNAWDMIYDSDSLSLVHYPWRCTGCRLCATICPAKAKHPVAVSQISADDRYLVTRTFKSRRCSQCRQIILIRDQDLKLCPSCQKRNKLLQGGVPLGN